MSEATPVLEARGLIRHFHIGDETVKAIDGIDLAVHQGQMVALLGASGSGKSSLLALLGGLDRPSGGEVYLCGELFGDSRGDPSENRRAAMRQKHIGFVFQSYNLLSSLTAAENVMFPLQLAGTPRRRARQLAQETLSELGLERRLNHRPMQLSGGEQQRVAIARAIVHGPDIVLADEPTGNLDSQNGEAIAGLITDLCYRLGKTVVLVTHDRGLAQNADRIVDLRDGRIIGEERGARRDLHPSAD